MGAAFRRCARRDPFRGRRRRQAGRGTRQGRQGRWLPRLHPRQDHADGKQPVQRPAEQVVRQGRKVPRPGAQRQNRGHPREPLPHLPRSGSPGPVRHRHPHLHLRHIRGGHGERRPQEAAARIRGRLQHAPGERAVRFLFKGLLDDARERGRSPQGAGAHGPRQARHEHDACRVPGQGGRLRDEVALHERRPGIHQWPTPPR